MSFPGEIPEFRELVFSGKFEGQLKEKPQMQADVLSRKGRLRWLRSLTLTIRREMF